MNNIDEIRSLATRILELTSDDGRHVKVVKSFLVKYRYMQWETKDVLDVLLHVSSLNNGHMRVNTCSAWVEDHCAFETLIDFDQTTKVVFNDLSGADHVRMCLYEMLSDVISNERLPYLELQFMKFIESLHAHMVLVSVTEI